MRYKFLFWSPLTVVGLKWTLKVSIVDEKRKYHPYVRDYLRVLV